MSDIVERLRELEAVESELACECDCPPEATANYRYAMTCADAADTIAALTARVEELEGALGKLIKACDEGRMVPRTGVSGMTIEAQLKNTVLNGVPVWPVEEAREVWEQSRAAITKGRDS